MKMKGMGRVFQRGSVWWVAYSYRGKEFRESSNSERVSEARKLLKKRLGEIGRGRLMGPIEEKVTFEELAEYITCDYEINGKRSLAGVNLSISHLREFFGLDRAVDITTDRVKVYISQRQKEISDDHCKRAVRKNTRARTLREKAKALQGTALGYRMLAEAGWLEEQAKSLEAISNGSINRELAALKRMFSLAVQAGKLTWRPYIPMLEENNARQGFLDDGDFKAVRERLPSYVRDPVTFLYRSGWRISEMRALEWRDVDLPGRLVRLRPEISKNKNGRPLPLDDELLEIIQRAFRDRRLDCEYVFQRKGRRIGDFKKAWRTACLMSGHPSLLVHDFRRTTVRNLTRARVPEKIAMTMTGHKTRSIFDRYNIVDERDLAQAADQLNSYLIERSQEPSVIPMRKTV